jgi:hypothetical protein
MRVLIRTVLRRLLGIIRAPVGLVFDLYVTPPDCPKTPLRKRIGATVRYRAAARGKALNRNEARLLELRGAHQKERCFVIGNGPSLNKLDLTLLAAEVTFGVNAIYTNFDRMGFYPTYYVVEDVFVAEDRAEEINRYRGSTKFFGNYLRYCLAHDERTLWINVITRYDEYRGFPHFSTNAARRVWVGGTVSYLCLQLAFYMGFQEVYLIGFDHSYSIPKDAIVQGSALTSVSGDPNHFREDYFGKGKRWHDPMVDRMAKAYQRAKVSYEEAGRRIMNATAGGKLEVFDRIPYEAVIR